MLSTYSSAALSPWDLVQALVRLAMRHLSWYHNQQGPTQTSQSPRSLATCSSTEWSSSTPPARVQFMPQLPMASLNSRSAPWFSLPSCPLSGTICQGCSIHGCGDPAQNTFVAIAKRRLRHMLIPTTFSDIEFHAAEEVDERHVAGSTETRKKMRGSTQRKMLEYPNCSSWSGALTYWFGYNGFPLMRLHTCATYR